MKLVITMSRRFGTGASIIAKELSERLQIPVYDKDFIHNEQAQKNYTDEAATVKELAKNPCIIIGRCASDILKDQLNVLNIYVYADKEDRIHRIMTTHTLSYEAAKELVESTDKQRADYYHKETGKMWGDVNDYHMILDTSELGIENCANILMQYFEKLEYI
ncbi:MAG: cytidylate kinase-like family protein [Hespellia sp.]|nr:cytidylate kinase-like family protein [Hespellia sp.]